MPLMRDCRLKWWDSDSIFLFPCNEGAGLGWWVLLRVFLELLARILSTWLLFGLVLSEVVGMKAINGASLEGGRSEKEAERAERRRGARGRSQEFSA